MIVSRELTEVDAETLLQGALPVLVRPAVQMVRKRNEVLRVAARAPRGEMSGDHDDHDATDRTLADQVASPPPAAAAG
jgi:hypothetical protein